MIGLAIALFTFFVTMGALLKLWEWISGKSRKKLPTYYGYVLKNGRTIFYVGQSVNPYGRFQVHLSKANPYGTLKERYIYHMLSRGKEPKLEIRYKTHSKADMNAWENRHIKKWGLTNTVGR